MTRRPTRACRAWAVYGHLQPVALPDTLSPLVIDRPASLVQQLGDLAIAVATVLPGKLDYIGRETLLVVTAAQLGLCQQIGEIVFLLSRHPVFADEPSLLPGQMLLTLVPDPLRWSVGDPHANSSKTSLELSFCAGAPTDGVPFGMGQHVFGRHR